MTTTPTTREAQRALDVIKKNTQKSNDLRARLVAISVKNDADILAAREAGARFREIADACERSVAWVQAAIRRERGLTPAAPAKPAKAA